MLSNIVKPNYLLTITTRSLTLHHGGTKMGTGAANGNGSTTTTSRWAAAAGQATGYDPNKFYVQAADARGHKSYVRLSMPPDVEREINKLMGTKAFPVYELTSDFIRDAVQHHLRRRSDQIGDMAIRESLRELFVEREVKARVDEMKRGSEFWGIQFEQFRRTFTTLSRDGAWDQLLGYLDVSEEMVDGAPEPYRTNLLRIFDEWRDKVPASFRS